MKTTEPPILCGTDLSENAAQVATVAAALAARAGKPLTLAHVADEFNARGDAMEKLQRACCASGSLRRRTVNEISEFLTRVKRAQT